MTRTDRDLCPTDDRGLVNLARQVDTNEERGITRPSLEDGEMDADVVIVRQGEGSFMLPAAADVDEAVDSIMVEDDEEVEEAMIVDEQNVAAKMEGNKDFEEDVPTVKRDDYVNFDDKDTDEVRIWEESTNPTVDLPRRPN